jgi:hypothetical protein
MYEVCPLFAHTTLVAGPFVVLDTALEKARKLSVTADDLVVVETNKGERTRLIRAFASRGRFEWAVPCGVCQGTGTVLDWSSGWGCSVACSHCSALGVKPEYGLTLRPPK